MAADYKHENTEHHQVGNYTYMVKSYFLEESDHSITSKLEHLIAEKAICTFAKATSTS
jgi:hypothetical protein